MSLECKIYQRELGSLGHGLPLYEPNPGNYDQVRLGDVGIILPSGYFQKIFSALPPLGLPPGCDINSRYGTPDGFVPLPDACRESIPSNEISAGWHWSDHVSRVEGQVDFLPAASPVGANVNFTVSQKQAAALLIEHSAHRYNASRLRLYKAYMLKNYKAWEKFIHDKGFEFRLRDMLLVTGFDLTANWATATFVERASQGGLLFRVTSPIAGSASASLTGSSEMSVSVPIRVGPIPYNPVSLTQPSSSDEVTTSSGFLRDQCIFIRGFRVSERLLIPRAIKAAAEPADLDMDRDLDTAGLIPVLTSLGSEDSEDDADVKTKLDMIHDMAFDAVFKNSDADVAIVHETDICKLLKAIKGIGENIITLEDLEARGMYMNVTVEYDPELQLKVGSVRETMGNLFYGILGSYKSSSTHVSGSSGRRRRVRDSDTVAIVPQAYKSNPKTTHESIALRLGTLIELNNFLQARGQAHLISWIDNSAGPQHGTVWTSTCKFDGRVVGEASAPTIKVARQQASMQALRALRGY